MRTMNLMVEDPGHRMRRVEGVPWNARRLIMAALSKSSLLKGAVFTGKQ
jgi:hypothetical protein